MSTAERMFRIEQFKLNRDKLLAKEQHAAEKKKREEESKTKQSVLGFKIQKGSSGAK